MIETRLLRYFLAIAREQSITRAAESLYVSQPTLSRQMKELEDALGVQLFVRGKRQTLLTEEGVYLRARAQEMMQIMEKTEATLKNSGSVIAGDIYVGYGETPAVAMLMDVYGEIQREHPDIAWRNTITSICRMPISSACSCQRTIRSHKKRP